MKTEKLVCFDCKAANEFRDGKRGSAFVEWFLWLTLFFPGNFLFSLATRKGEKNLQILRE